MTKKRIALLLLLLLAILAFFAYRTLMPAGPITDPVDNPIRDRATTSADIDESSIPTEAQRNLYWGDMHVHTNMSFDAYIGGAGSSPSDAYRFAKGETINILREDVTIKRPLDFAAVTDHSEFLGELYTVHTKGAPGHYSAMAMYFRSIGLDTVKMRKLFEVNANRLKSEPSHIPFFQGFETTKKAWDIILDAAEEHYQPGKFTTFAAYEWTLGASKSHIHRNVFFRDMVVPDYPLSALEANNENELWASLEQYTKGGATVLAIPHNSNLSVGGAFMDKTKATALTQSKWEPLVEIHQGKGNSEVHPNFWQTDEFAEFETYAYNGKTEKDYVRYALKKGLEYKESFGVNPFKFGIIGSTDTHDGIPGNTEEYGDFIGNHAFLDNNAENRSSRRWILEPGTGKQVFDAVNPGGLMAVWSEANTRGHIFDAMQRKETYGTSGGRIQVRFFGGYNFDNQYDSYESLVADGYAKGVAMGGDLPQLNPATDKQASPSFIVWANKDSEGANLDRIQVIKGWYKDGQLEEKIYNVAVSDNRVIQADGSVAAIEAPVNMETGAWDRSKGAVSLQTVWKDPDFDPASSAFYYLRVLEIPTARYTLWDKIRHGVTYPDRAALTTQERAWTSPIWYN